MHVRADKLQRLEARLAATEYLTVNLYAQAYLKKAKPQEEMRAVNDGLRVMLEDQTLPGHVQSWRDGLSTELQCAMEHALVLMEEIIERTARSRVETVGRFGRELSFEV